MMTITKKLTGFPGVLALGLSASLCALTAATAGPLSIGRGEGGGLDVGVDLGGVKADVSVGGDSVADADVSVGDDAVDADVSVGGESVADVSVGVGRDRGIGADVSVGGSDTVADVSVGVGEDIGADVSVGGDSVAGVSVGVGPDVGVDVGVGGPAPGTSPPGTNPPGNSPPGTMPPGTNPPGVTPPGTPPPGTVPPAVATVPSTPPRVPAMLACASADGNTTAFNGYALTDRSGRVVGVIHSAVLDGNARISTVSIKGVNRGCTTLKNGTFQVAGYSIQGAFDAARLGLATQ